MKKLHLHLLAIAALAAVSLASCTKGVNLGMAQGALGTALGALTLSNDQVMSYSKQAVAQMDAQASIAPASNKYTQRLNKLVGPLTDVDGIPLNFKVYITPEINAFATADGSVRVYSGIMDMMTDEELLGILGHEIGHVGMHHSLNAMKQAMMNSAIRDAIGSTSATAAALTQSQLSQLGDLYLSSKFSRKQENEADDYGYGFLKAAGLNPWAMVSAFEKMQNYENSAAASSGNAQMGLNLASMFSDHPATSERIKRMTEHCQADGIARPSK